MYGQRRGAISLRSLPNFCSFFPKPTTVLWDLRAEFLSVFSMHQSLRQVPSFNVRRVSASSGALAAGQSPASVEIPSKCYKHVVVHRTSFKTGWSVDSPHGSKEPTPYC